MLNLIYLFVIIIVFFILQNLSDKLKQYDFDRFFLKIIRNPFFFKMS
jgi:hypothetical protein